MTMKKAQLYTDEIIPYKIEKVEKTGYKIVAQVYSFEPIKTISVFHQIQSIVLFTYPAVRNCMTTNRLNRTIPVEFLQWVAKYLIYTL